MKKINVSLLMKNTYTILLFTLFSISLVGCSGDKDKSNASDSGSNSSSSIKSKDKSMTNDGLVEESDNNDMVDNGTNGDSNSEVTNADKSASNGDPVDSPFDNPFGDGGSFGGGNGDVLGTGSGPKTSSGGNSSTADTYNFHAYKNLDALLKKYVSSSGKVNYSGIKSNKSSLDKIIKEFKDNYPSSGWSSNQKLSYWINAYNIFTIKLIVDNYPTSSITKITAKPWDKKFVKLGSKTYSLNQVENEIIRKKFNEPRIHFALNCASKSCPVLLNAAYTSSNVQSKLTSQTKRFFNDSSKNKFDNKKKIYISKIFDWYKEDFTKNGSTVVKFINKYRTEQLNSPKIYYTDYSWDLNN